MLQSKLAPADVRAAHLEPIDDVGSTLAALLREQPMARVCVLPEGLQTIPYLNRHAAMARAARP
jgi:hypothetical protein